MQLPVNYDNLSRAERRLVREEYIFQQNGICIFCNEPLDMPPSLLILNKKINKDLFPNGFLNFPVHLHHDHDTGMTIGTIHARCNAVSWQYHGK